MPNCFACGSASTAFSENVQVEAVASVAGKEIARIDRFRECGANLESAEPASVVAGRSVSLRLESDLAGSR